MKIGAVHLRSRFTLAPMEEHTNPPFRGLMKRHGAGLVCTERIDAVDVARRERRAMRMLATSSQEAPRAGQLSGADPATLAEAARVVEEQGFDLVDLNFECPIRRLLQRNEGGALLADPAAIGKIVAAVTRAVSIPVTLKIRTGPDADQETAPDVAQAATESGAAAIELHARSVRQAYVGEADWFALQRLKAVATIPVIGSGSVRTAADAVRMLQETGVDAVGIGRGCLGNPWIFSQAAALWQNANGSSGLGSRLPSGPAGPSRAERGKAALELVEGEFQYYGAALARRRLPRVSCYFAKDLPNFAAFRQEVQTIQNLSEFKRLIRQFFVE